MGIVLVATKQMMVHSIGIEFFTLALFLQVPSNLLSPRAKVRFPSIRIGMGWGWLGELSMAL